MFEFVKNWLKKSEEIQPDADTSCQCEFDAGGLPLVSDTAPPAPEFMELPLSVIYRQLPADLQARLRLPVKGNASVFIPLEVIGSQLDRGAVKVNFGELRQMTEEGVFYSQTDCDHTLVELPLAEIMARLDTASLPRREQKPVEVPDEITSPFAQKGRGLHIYKPETPPTQAFIRKIEESPVTSVVSPARGNIISVPPVAQPSAIPPTPAVIPASLEMRPTVAPPAIKIQTAPQPADTATNLPIGLTALSSHWPQAVREEIAQMNLADAIINLPLTLIEDGLKKGKIVLSWRQLRSRVNSPVAALTFSTHDADLLDLPLSLIAPLFLAKRQAAKAHQKIALDENIPDLFSGTKRPEPAKEATNGNGTHYKSPDTTTTTFDTVQTGKARVAGNLPRSGTEFLKRYAAPNDIVARAVALDGVAGALVTLPDGLQVASQLPPNVSGDTLSAFLPEVFSRVSQSSRELRMGELRSLSFTTGNIAWEVYKVGSIFFAAFGRAGETLPTAQLTSLAAELDRKPK